MREITQLPGGRSKNPPTPQSIIEGMRNDNANYAVFADYMVRAVHGKYGYAQKAGSKSTTFSEFIPISQEAFALLLYENGYKNWIWMHDNNASSSEDTEVSNEGPKPGYLCTGVAGGDGEVFTRRNNGWSQAGMQAFNSLYAKVKESRANDNGEFDKHYKNHWRTKHSVSKYKRKRVTETPAIESICDDLVDPDVIAAV
jgi:hypothetical protein